MFPVDKINTNHTTTLKEWIQTFVYPISYIFITNKYYFQFRKVRYKNIKIQIMLSKERTILKPGMHLCMYLEKYI